MRTKRFWQPALRKLFSLPTPHNRQEALQFLLGNNEENFRGAGIVLTAPQQADDGDKYEEQIVFQPENCQENLRILEALFTVLVKGVITQQQGESVSQLLATDVVSLQELMRCICSPRKSLDPREQPLSDLWKNSSRTRRYLESLGLKEILQGTQLVVICPENCQLLNILALFFGNID
ncbi:hypothetical protein OS493_016054 [Desmophyllum pertusum]|uniref:Uncharacterized protein n=1 Tax=Desmophyllum pertusum TaxID=174260 RepID=A0A9X0D8Z5_9CNID|nr:hypothetical protein OS493_016054 [Desmophyllum pertusum]